MRQQVDERARELATVNESLQAEIFERQSTEALLDGQKRVLEMVAADAPLSQSMAALLRLIEAHVPGMLGSILLLDEQGRHVRHCAAPNLPPEYIARIDGRPIGPKAGSCGTAAYYREAVFVEDIATDSRWKDYRAAALPHGLRACWSTPIFGAQQHVLGTFAMYYRQPALPEPEHLRLIEIATHIAAIAISHERIQAALREREAKLKEAQRLAKIGYWERDLVSDRIRWSEETYRIFGRRLRRDALSQAELQEMIHPEDRPVQKQAFIRALQGDRLYDVEYRIVRPDGDLRFVHVRDEIAYDASGRPVRMFGTVQDITELKENEQRLRQAQADLARVARLTMMGELAASIAHEINQPLAGVVTNANACLGWLAAKRPNLGEARKAVSRIARDGKRAGQVIARIRTLLKKGEPVRRPLDINEVIREAAALMQPELNRKRVTLRRELAPELPRVWADTVQLEQVLLNLIVNAADSMNEVRNRARVLRIRTGHPKPRMVQVEIGDTGTGIASDQAKHLFQPFFTTKPHGLGLGLAISRSIIEAHSGKLWATANRGPGMTFHFTLPIQEGGPGEGGD